MKKVCMQLKDVEQNLHTGKSITLFRKLSFEKITRISLQDIGHHNMQGQQEMYNCKSGRKFRHMLKSDIYPPAKE